MTICDTFKKTAIGTWKKLSKAEKVGLTLGEETITDINLLDILAARHVELKKVKKFNKIKEGENGADWEWWLTGSSGKWLGFRIQAKIIKDDEYKQLHYKDQTGNLISESYKNKMIPFYCLYTMTTSSIFIKEFDAKGYCDSYKVFGCSLVYASTINILGTKKHISDLIQYMIPWHAIFCSNPLDNVDLPHRALAVIKATLKKEEIAEDDHIRNFDLSDTTPYGSNIFSDTFNIDNIEKHDEDLAGIIFIKENQKAKTHQ